MTTPNPNDKYTTQQGASQQSDSTKRPASAGQTEQQREGKPGERMKPPQTGAQDPGQTGNFTQKAPPGSSQSGSAGSGSGGQTGGQSQPRDPMRQPSGSTGSQQASSTRKPGSGS